MYIINLYLFRKIKYLVNRTNILKKETHCNYNFTKGNNASAIPHCNILILPNCLILNI